MEVAELWRRCVEQPDDDDARGVLADLLQANGDARGELMALQLLPADPDNAPARRARIRELTAEYARVWLGPLRDWARGASFERGMITRLELVATQPVAAPDDRELWSIEELVVGHDALGTLRRILASPAARSVRRLAIDDAQSLAALAECSQPIAHVACLHSLDMNVTPFAQQFFTAIGKRDSIVSLCIAAEGFPDLSRRTWFERLAHVHVACAMRRGLALWPQLPRTMALTISPTPGLDNCALAFPSDCRIELRRDGTARVAGEWLLQSLDVLDELPPEITRLEIEDTSEPIVSRIRVAVAGKREIALRGLVGRAGNIRW